MARPGLLARDLAVSCPHRSGWITTAAVFVIFVVIFGPLYNYSILFVSLQDEFGANAAVTGLVGSIANGLSCFLSPLAGILQSRVGYRPAFALAVCSFSLGCLLGSFATSIAWTFPTLGLFTSIGSGTTMHLGSSLLFVWFPGRNNVRALSFALIGTAGGMLIYAPLMTAFTALYGWRVLLRFLAGSTFAIGALDILLLGEPPSDSTPGKEETKESKAGNDSEAPTSTPTRADKSTGTLEAEMDGEADADDVTATRTRSGEKGEAVSGAQTSWRWSEGVRRLDVWLYTVSILVTTLCVFFFTINCASYMRTLYFSPEDTALVLMLLSLGEIFSKVLMALLGDHLPCLMIDVVTAATVISAVASAVLGWTSSLAWVISLATVSGIMRGVFSALIYSAGYQLFPEYGGSVVTSLALVPWGLGIFLTAPVTGGLFDISGSYTLTLGVVGALFALSSLLTAALSIRRLRLRRARDVYACAEKDIAEGGTETKAVDGTVNLAFDGSEVG